MNETKRRTLTALACACFAVHAASQLVNTLQYGALGQMRGAVIYLLLVLGLALRSGLLITGGGVLAIVMSIPNVIGRIGNYVLMHNAVVIVTGLLSVAVALFLLLLGLSKRRSVALGYVAAALNLLSVLMTYFGWQIPGLGGLQQPIRPFQLALPVLWTAGIILTGYLRREMPPVSEAWNRLRNK